MWEVRLFQMRVSGRRLSHIDPCKVWIKPFNDSRYPIWPPPRRGRGRRGAGADDGGDVDTDAAQVDLDLPIADAESEDDPEEVAMHREMDLLLSEGLAAMRADCHQAQREPGKAPKRVSKAQIAHRRILMMRATATLTAALLLLLKIPCLQHVLTKLLLLQALKAKLTLSLFGQVAMASSGTTTPLSSSLLNASAAMTSVSKPDRALRRHLWRRPRIHHRIRRQRAGHWATLEPGSWMAAIMGPRLHTGNQ